MAPEICHTRDLQTVSGGPIGDPPLAPSSAEATPATTGFPNTHYGPEPQLPPEVASRTAAAWNALRVKEELQAHTNNGLESYKALLLAGQV